MMDIIGTICGGIVIVVGMMFAIIFSLFIFATIIKFMLGVWK